MCDNLSDGYIGVKQKGGSVLYYKEIDKLPTSIKKQVVKSVSSPKSKTNYTVKELRAKLKAANYKGYSKMKKDEMLKILPIAVELSKYNANDLFTLVFKYNQKMITFKELDQKIKKASSMGKLYHKGKHIINRKNINFDFKMWLRKLNTDVISYPKLNVYIDLEDNKIKSVLESYENRFYKDVYVTEAKRKEIANIKRPLFLYKT